MIPTEEALRIVLGVSERLPPVVVSLQEALGKVLAEYIRAPDPLPPYPASVKDAYAVVASDGPREYPVITESRAGDDGLGVTVTPGTVAYVTTGESLYPKEMGPGIMSVDGFLVNGIVKLDQNIEERVKRASSNGCVLRYVCVIEGSSVQVGIREVPKDSPLGRLRGSDNVVEIYSRCYKEQPLVIQGAGAGNDTTAAGVLADIIDLQDLFS